MNKKILLAVLSLAVLGGALYGVNQVSAQETSTNPHDSLIQRLVARFGLNENEINQVFEEEHEARHAEMAKRMEERLSQAVTDGKLTEEQKQKILAKHEEMKNSREAEMESFKNMTEEERRTAMEKKHTELTTWAKVNDIPMEYLMFKIKVMNGMPGDFHMKIAE